MGREESFNICNNKLLELLSTAASAAGQRHLTVFQSAFNSRVYIPTLSKYPRDALEVCKTFRSFLFRVCAHQVQLTRTQTSTLEHLPFVEAEGVEGGEGRPESRDTEGIITTL